MKILIGNEKFTGEASGLQFENGVCEVAKGHETHSRQIANFLGYEVVEDEKPKAKPKARTKAAPKEKTE